MKSKLRKFKFKKIALICNLPTIFMVVGSMVYARGTIYNETLGDDITVEASADAYPNLVGHAFGVYIQQDQHTVVGDRLTITVSGEGADGLRSNPSGLTNWQQAKGSISIGDDLKITMKGVSGDGVNANGATKITIGNNAIIITEYDGALKYSNGSIADGSHGVRANFHSEITIGNGLLSSTKGQESYAIYSAQGLGIPGATEGAKIIIGDDGTGITEGDRSHAAYVTSSKGSIKMGDRATLITKGSNAHAAYVSSTNGQINLGSFTSLKTEGEKSYALYTSGTGSSTTIGNNAQLNTEGTGSHLVYTTARNSIIGLGSGSILTSIGENSYGIFISGYRNVSGSTSYGNSEITLGDHSKIITEGDSSYGVYMYGHDGKVTLGENTQVSTIGMAAHALYGHGSQATPTSSVYGDNGKIIVKDNGRLQTTGAGAHGVYVDWATSSIDFQGGATISVTGPGSYALYANKGTLASSNVGKFDITGDMRVDEGKIDLDMINGSQFIGNTSINGTGIVNLSIAGTDSQWRMSKSSELTHLNLQSDAQVYLGDQTAQLLPSNQVILTMNELSGSGIFNMRTNIADEFADLVKITGTANGVHGIMVSDKTTGGANVTGSEVTKLVEMMGGNAQFNLLNLNSQNINGIDIGAYVYQLSQVADVGDASSWVLSGGVLPPVVPVPPVTPPVTPPVVPPVTPPVEPPLTNTAKASISMLNINYLLAYAETQTLLQRMGELRDNKSSGDVWSRVYGGKLNSFTAALENLDFNYSGFQLGLDHQVRNAYGNFYLGGMVGYSTGKAKYHVGKGDTRSYSMGIYGTYQNDDDFYIDGVLKYTNIRNQFNTYTSGGYKVFGKGTSSGLSASIELGKRFYFNDKKEGVYLEPQAQLVYSHQGATTVRSSNRLNTHLSSVDSLLGRVSLVAGYNLQESEDPMSIYFKTGLIKEFKGKAEYAFNQGELKSYRMDGHWWENGVGVTAKFKQQHNFYLEASHASGRKFNKLQLNVGYRFEF